MLTLAAGRGEHSEAVDPLIEAWREGEYDKDELIRAKDRAGTIRESAVMQRALLAEGEQPRIGVWESFKVLFKRQGVTFWRNPALIRQNLIQVVVTALALGLIFLRAADKFDQQSVSDRNGALIILLMNTGFSNATAVVSTFGEEKDIFLREYQAGYYGVLPYYFARTTVGMPVQVLLTSIFATICYWMFGLTEEFT